MEEKHDNLEKGPDRFSGGSDRLGGHDDPGRPGPLVGSSQPVGGSPGAPGRRDLVQGLTVVVVAVWCISALAIGMNTAGSFWEWLPIFAFGGAAPALFLWQANRVLTPSHEFPSSLGAKDKEKELLGALAERGELTSITAAIRTSLTADEAARMLEELAGKGYLQLRMEEGVQTYALQETDRRRLSRTHPASVEPGSRGGGTPRPLDEDLSERELEVLVLLASGRTNSEIAGDLFVAQGTVKAHVANIYRKLDAGNRAQALSRARGLKLLP